MGDRGNIKIYQDSGDAAIFFYTHHRGSEIYGVVKRALARRKRWDDGAYLARIIFCELVKGDEDGDTGFGISTSISDNEHTIIGVNPNTREVTFESEGGTVSGKMSFDDFVLRKDKYSEGEEE